MVQNFFAQGLVAADTRQPYYLEKALDAPGVYIQPSYKISGISSADKTKSIQTINAVIEAIKKVYPKPVGAHVGFNSGIFENYTGLSEFKNGPYRTYISIPFYDLSKTRSGTIEASGEYASSMEIWINNVDYILQANYVQNGNKRVYRTPKPGIPVNGFPKYNNMILIIPPGKSLPWRPATKQEYLENVVVSLKSQSGSKQDIADGEQLLASMSPTEKKQIAYLRKAKYSNAQKGFSDFGIKWAGFSDAADTTAEQLVIIDENFYDRSLPRSSFQVIVIERRTIFSSGIGTNRDGTTKYDTMYKVHNKRMQSIVMAPGFLSSLQNDLGKIGTSFVKTEIKPFVLDPALVKWVNGPKAKAPKQVLDKIKVPFITENKAPVRDKSADTIRTVLSARNDKALAVAGQIIHDTSELRTYINDLYKKISQALKTNYGTDVSLPDHATGADISDGSVFAWANGKLDQALLLSLTAAVNNPGNGAVVSNLAAMLNLCHVQYKSIPLSNYLLIKTPNNSTVLNNIGQSYLALGETEKAEQYLQRCVQKSTWHPEANTSLAYINDARRNKANVIKYAENSLRGAFTVPAYNLLTKYKKDARLMDYVKHRYIRPEYFNPDKYKLPGQCKDVSTADSLRQLYAEYFKYLTKLYEKYNKLSKDEEKLAEVTMPQKVKENFRTHHNKLNPFNELGYNMLLSVQQDYSDKMKPKEETIKQIMYEQDILRKEYNDIIKQIDEKSDSISAEFGEGNPGPEDFEENICKEKDAVGNLFLIRLAYLNEEVQNAILPDFYQYVNDRLFWMHVACIEHHQYEASFYSLLSTFFSTILSLCHTTTNITPCWTPNLEKINAKPVFPEVEEPDCPIDFSKKFFFGTISIDCDAMHFSAGEGVLVNMDYEFASGAMTMAFGVGANASVEDNVAELDFGTLSGGAEAGGSMKFFLSLDKNGHPTDGGFIWEAEAKLKEKFKSDFSSLSRSKSVGLDATVKLGINSGYTFSGSTFKTLDEIFGAAPEKQQNKNVKIYKPQ